MARRYVNPNRTGAELRAWAEENRAAQAGVVKLGANRPIRSYEPRAVVTREARTYSPGTDPLGRQFAADVLKRFLWRDPGASDRLDRHMGEERVERPALMARAASGTGNFAGLLVPQFLVDLYGASVQALRPFADACEPHPLPPQGMSINVPTATTASGAAVQAAENTAVASTAPNATLTTENVTTVSGFVQVSRQALERGATLGEVVMADLARSYATALDTQLVTAAVTGLGGVAVLTTYNNATPAPTGAYSKVLAATAGVRKALLGVAKPDLAIMTGTRWDWFSEPGTSWPLIMAGGAAGTLPNSLRVIADDNIPVTFGGGTNQDRIYLAASRDCLLFELPGSPLFVRVEQASAAAALGVQLVAWSYAAWCFRRHAGAVGAVDGTGLVVPVFT